MDLNTADILCHFLLLLLDPRSHFAFKSTHDILFISVFFIYGIATNFFDVKRDFADKQKSGQIPQIQFLT